MTEIGGDETTATNRTTVRERARADRNVGKRDERERERDWTNVWMRLHSSEREISADNANISRQTYYQMCIKCYDGCNQRERQRWATLTRREKHARIRCVCVCVCVGLYASDERHFMDCRPVVRRPKQHNNRTI